MSVRQFDRNVFLLNNKLDKDIQNIIKPFNILLTIFNSSKFKIKDGYITECEKKFHIPLYFINLFMTICSMYSMVSDTTVWPLAAISTVFVYFCLYFLQTTLLAVVNIFLSDVHISLIIKLQEVHRNFVFHTDLVKNFIIWNWISLSALPLLITFYTYIYFIATNITINMYDLNCVLVIIGYDLNFIYAIRIITMLTIYVRKWIDNTNVETVVNGVENKKYLKNMFQIYKNILDVYKTYQTSFEVVVSYIKKNINKNVVWELLVNLCNKMYPMTRTFSLKLHSCRLLTILVVVEIKLLSSETMEKKRCQLFCVESKVIN